MYSELPPPRLDYKSIADNLTFTIQNSISRNAPVPQADIESVAKLYNQAKELSKELNTRRHLQSLIGEKIRKAANDEERQKAKEEALALKQEVHKLQADLQSIETSYQAAALYIPNDTHPEVPIGPEPSARVLATHGPAFVEADPKRDHVSVAKQLDLLDLESGATVTGSSWYFLKNEAALLEMALTNYSMSIAMKHGFIPVTTPDVVRSDIAVRCGFQPRDTGDALVSHMYHITPNHESAPQLILSGTAEIPLAGMFANKIHPEVTLPLRYVGMGHAFRQEAGARSADTRGLYRVHQFTKVELFGVSTEAQSEEMMEEMKDIQIRILQGLNLHFRFVMSPCFRSLTILILYAFAGSLTCPQKSSVQAHTASTTWKPGCLDAAPGAKSPPSPTAPTTNLVAYTSDIAPLKRRPRVPIPACRLRTR